MAKHWMYVLVLHKKLKKKIKGAVQSLVYSWFCDGIIMQTQQKMMVNLMDYCIMCFHIMLKTMSYILPKPLIYLVSRLPAMGSFSLYLFFILFSGISRKLFWLHIELNNIKKKRILQYTHHLLSIFYILYRYKY